MLALQQWIARVTLSIAISFVQSTAEAADSYSVHFLKNFLRSFLLKNAIVGQCLQALPLRSYRLQHFFFRLMRTLYAEGRSTPPAVSSSSAPAFDTLCCAHDLCKTDSLVPHFSTGKSRI